MLTTCPCFDNLRTGSERADWRSSTTRNRRSSMAVCCEVQTGGLVSCVRLCVCVRGGGGAVPVRRRRCSRRSRARWAGRLCEAQSRGAVVGVRVAVRARARVRGVCLCRCAEVAEGRPGQTGEQCRMPCKNRSDRLGVLVTCAPLGTLVVGYGGFDARTLLLMRR